MQEPLLVVQDPLLKAAGVPLGWLRSCHCWCYWQCHPHSPEWGLEAQPEWGQTAREGRVLAPQGLSLGLGLGLVLVAELEV